MDSGSLGNRATRLRVPESRWDTAPAGAHADTDLLIIRSRLLGGDLAVTNYGGGNTSAKVLAKDPLTGAEVRVLWVKGSGGDLGTIGADGFAVLSLEKLEAADKLYRGAEHEDAMVDFLPHCAFNLSTRAASIDTPLHALLPFAHIDHVHPDAVTAIAAAGDGERLTQDVFGGRIGWLPWRRPGWELARQLAAAVKAHPKWKGVVLQNHGLVTWGDDARACYENTIVTIRAAAEFLNARLAVGVAFGGQKSNALQDGARKARASEFIARLRPQLAPSKVAHYSDTQEVLEFVCSQELERLAQIGTSCPDHFLRTKIRPLVLSADADDEAMKAAIAGYRASYGRYYEACKHANSPSMRDPDPVLIAAPGIGLVSFARDKATARIASEFFQNAINVIRGAESVSRYQGLPDQEAFDIEYWLLEEAKLRRMPAPKPLQGKVAMITGGAGGIGRAIAQRLSDDGACVFLVDRSADALANATESLVTRGGADKVAGALADVTHEQSMLDAFRECVLAFGGVDILVANAGLASSAPIEETSLEQWREAFAVLGDGYFLAAREAFKLMKAQGGGSMVFVASKNALAATPGAAAYASAKAAELHLARCLALEGAPHNIRVNAVNPDAVLRGSQIWNGAWRAERAAAYGIAEDQLEEHYRKRSLLQQMVLPEDVAEAVAFFAGSASAKSTGNILNVDGGNMVAFTR